MALEIRELIIKVQVSEDNNRNRNGTMNEQQLLVLKKEIMEECMEKLKHQLEKKKDR